MGLGAEIGFAFLVMRWNYGRLFFEKLGAAANWLLDFAYYGSTFVFGDLAEKNSPRGFYFAFQALPTIIFIAALFAVLYYLGIMQLVVKGAARVMTGLMGASGAGAGVTRRPFAQQPYAASCWVITSSARWKRPACDFSAFASVSNQSAISSKPSSRAARAMPGYMSVYSCVSPAMAAWRLSSVGRSGCRSPDRRPPRGIRDGHGHGRSRPRLSSGTRRKRR